MLHLFLLRRIGSRVKKVLRKCLQPLTGCNTKEVSTQIPCLVLSIGCTNEPAVTSTSVEYAAET